MRVELKANLLQRLERMPRGLAAHIQRTRKEVTELARRFGVDKDVADIAALAHDVARAMERKKLVSLAREFGIPILPIEEGVPVLLHGPVGAEILAKELGLADEDLLEATRVHTNGKEKMVLLSKIVFLGDKLDPVKEKMYPFLPQVRELAQKDLDKALLAFMDADIIQHIQLGHAVHPFMLEARNGLIMERGHR